jgi:hypothetical protein
VTGENASDQEHRMTDETKPQGSAAMSPASAGSHAAVAWAVTPTGKDGEIDCEFVYPCEATAGDVALGCNGVVVPLYRQSTLTDEEREAVAAAIKSLLDDPYDGAPISPHAATLRNLLERMK